MKNILYCFAVQDCSVGESALYQRSSTTWWKKTVGNRIWRGKWMRTCKCTKNTHGISNKGKKNQILGYYSETSASLGKPNDPECTDVTNEWIWIFPNKGRILPSTRRKKFLHYDCSCGEDARQCAKNTQSPRIRRIQNHSHRLMRTKKIGPILNVGKITIRDVPSIEVHTPSLSSPEVSYGFWVMKVCERNSWSQLCNCALRFIVSQKGGEFRQCEFRIFQAYRGTSLARFTRFE